MERERTVANRSSAFTLFALLVMAVGLFATSAGAATAQCYPPPCGGGGGGGGATTTLAPGATTTTTAAPGATTTTVAGGGSTTTTVKTSTTTTTTPIAGVGPKPSAGAPGTTDPPRGVLSRTGSALTKPLVALALAVGLFGLLLVVLVRRAEAVRPR